MIYRIFKSFRLILKDVFRWHVIILINKPHIFCFGKTWFDFSCKEVWCFVVHDCYYLHHLPIQLFKTALFFFFIKNWSDIAIVKNILCQSCFLSHTSLWIMSSWYKTILDHLEWTCKVKKKKKKLTDRTPSHMLNEFRRVNNHTPETAHICSCRAMYHTALFFALQCLN